MKIGFLSLPLTGHLNPMTALARKLQSRRYEVVFIGVPDIEPVVRAADLDFVPFCENEYPPGSVAKSWGGVANLHGLDVVRYTARELTSGLVKTALEHLPGKIAETGVNALILDTAYRLLELVPMHLRLPYVQIWNILHFDLSGSTPLALYSWPYETSPEALARNVAGLEIVREIRGPMMPIAQSYAERNGLEIDWSDPAATVSKLAVITQTPKEFDFPIPHLPPQFHYAGPFHDHEGREPVPFPWEKLTGKPLIYASMGTLVNGLKNVYGTILEAVGEFPELQVVLSAGRNFNPADLEPIPSNTIVVRIAPQIELLERAALCITHAGLNTALEALAQGVPMVAIPIGYDQPGVAARIAYHGIGEFVEIGNLSARHLSELIAKVKANPNYHAKARWFQKILGETRGLDVAADIIERVFGEHLQAKTFAPGDRQINVATPTTEPEAQSINPEDKSEWLQTRPGERCLIRVSAADTNGAYSVVEIVADPGDGTPIHVHQNEDEHFVILEGTARIVYGDKAFDAAAGTAVNLSKGVPHAWGNLFDSPLRMVVISSPGACEEILRLIAKGGDIDIMALSEKFGVRIVGPMLSS